MVDNFAEAVFQNTSRLIMVFALKEASITRKDTANTISSAPKIWSDVYEELLNIISVDSTGRLRIKPGQQGLFSRLEDELREQFIYHTLDRELIEQGYKWVELFIESIEELKQLAGLYTIMLSRELKSFTEDILSHLKKKIFIYTNDLLRKRIRLDEYERKAGAAIRTSFRTNLRSIYQNWVFIKILKNLLENNGVLVYPENKYLPLERWGRQKTGVIPPNAITYTLGKGYLSFFLEAPRPIGWEDTSDLRKAWKLYTALRPDMMVYGGRILNIILLGRDPPIKRPDIIIECKELEDWYLRVRDIKGPLAQPLTAEEWRNKWIEGLWTGLADVLGVDRDRITETVREKKGVRLREYHIVTLYKSLYKPKQMILVSRTKIPDGIRRELERDHSIIVYDNVGFNESLFNEVVDILLRHAQPDSETILKLESDLKELLEKAYNKAVTEGFKGTLHEFLKYILSKYVNGA